MVSGSFHQGVGPMDDFQQDCAHVVAQFEVKGTVEDRTTRRRWTRALVAFYACVLLAGAIAIVVTQQATSTEQHASLK
jgi:hypothetical protein